MGPENTQALAALAQSQTHFIEKYVAPPKLDLLTNDVQIALRTTPEYARDFASKVIEYFQAYPPTPPADTTYQTSLPSASPSSANAPATKSEFLQSVEAVKITADQFSQTKADELNRFVTQEIEQVRKDIQQVLETQRTLEDSLAQLKRFLDDFIARHPPPSAQPYYPAPPAGGMPPPGPSTPMYPTPPTAAPAPNLTPYEQSLLRMQEQENRFPPSTISPQNLLPTLTLEPAEPDVVKIQTALSPDASPAPGVTPGRPSPIQIITWEKKKKIMVMMDHVCLEGVIRVTARMAPVKGTGIFSSDSTAKFGFQMDAAPGTSLSAQPVQIYYKSNGKLHIKSQVEKAEELKDTDIISFECDMQRRICYVFKNNLPLPIRLIRIPLVIRFFIESEGVGSHVDLLGFSLQPNPTDLSLFQTQNWRTYTVDKMQ